MNKPKLEPKKEDPIVAETDCNGEDRQVTEEEGRAARSGTWEGAD